MNALFLCVANSARSQMAHGWCRALSDTTVDAHSAGSQPTSVRPEAVAVMAEVGVDLRMHTSNGVDAVPAPDVVATLCGEEECPFLAGEAESLSWATADPAEGGGTWQQRLQRFRVARDIIRDRVDGLLVDKRRRLAFDVRDHFPLDPNKLFVNHGSFGATPTAVLQAQDALRAAFEAQPMAFVLGANERSGPLLARLAPWLGADADELAFVSNATEGANAVVGSLDLAPGDVILTFDHEYSGVRNVIEHVAARVGATVETLKVPFPCSGREEVLAAFEQPWPDNVRLLVFDHISSQTALHMPAKEIVALAHERGVPVFVDGAQALGQVPVDLHDLGADYWVGNAHKWLFSPKGSALLFAQRSRQEGLHPAVISLGYGQGFAAEFGWTGTRDITACLSVGAALDYVEELGGFDRVMAHNVMLCQQASDVFERVLEQPAPAPPSMRVAMASVRFDVGGPATREHADAWMRMLWARDGIDIKFEAHAGALWVRMSANIYNTLDDFERAAAAVHAHRLAHPDGLL